MPRDWDATTYDRLPIPMTAWGATVVGWLDLRGDERVLDAGCGTGQVTALLLDRLPEGKLIALDGSSSMIAAARERLGEDRVEYLVADLADPLPIVEPVDAVLSTATFHWIADHDALFTLLADVMKPGAQLVAQCGGVGNIANVETALRTLGYDFGGKKHFATVEATAARLEATGFTDIEVWLHDEPTPLPPDDLEPYLATICLGDIIEPMTLADRRSFVTAVAERMPEPVIDYVRLNIRARLR
ncbi:MAG: trans-aconitate 2-methyltransferase [Actinomycetota bacterium]|nr:trans-aconitate 2-methyltransferase [Actinomycetota bacterium]